jgi:hypothetical protein
MNVRWRGTRSSGPSSRGQMLDGGARAAGSRTNGHRGDPQMDMDNNNGEHETENNGAEVTYGHETGDSTTSSSGHRSRRRSHAVMPPLVLDSEDGKTVIKPTGEG